MEPLISIVIPTSNIVDADYGDDFTLLVNLLSKQTYPYIEILAMDNASTDGTEVLLKEYKNSGYLNFYSEKDTGKFDAMNKGIMRAKGKYIAFLSCNDFYHDIVALEDIVNLMEEGNADFAFAPTYCRNEEDNTVMTFPPAIYNIFHIQPCPRQAFVFKKSTIEKIGGFDNKFKMLADYDLMIRLVLNECVGVYFNRISLTYPVAKEITLHSLQAETERRYIYYKNYKNLYNMSDDVLDRLVAYGEFPKPLLQILEKKFPPEDKELFYDNYAKMCDFYKDLQRAKQEQERAAAREQRNRPASNTVYQNEDESEG